MISQVLMVLVLALATVLTGCDEQQRSASGDATSSSEALSGETIVFAAASLTEGFEEIAAAFEEQHPDTRVTFSFGPSSGLAAQIAEHAPAEVFASADEANMKKAADAGRVAGAPSVFARNKLEIAVPAGNPKGITGLGDLAEPGTKVVLAAPQVPVGRYGAEALSKAGVTVRPVSLEQDVKAVATKVSLGEADAGIVYRTDVAAAGGKLQGITIPDEHNVVAAYPIARIRDAANPELAAAFVDFVLSEAGRGILVEHGFVPQA
jgi:molybdate transport system substrate-binding protein